MPFFFCRHIDKTIVLSVVLLTPPAVVSLYFLSKIFAKRSSESINLIKDLEVSGNPFSNNRYKDVFGRLNCDILEKWTAKWALQYSSVSKIIIYGLPLKCCAESNFIIYFNFKSKEEAANFEQDYAMRLYNFTGSEFAEVYKEFPTYRFQYEWYFTTSKEPWMDDKFSLILFKKKKRVNKMKW